MADHSKEADKNTGGGLFGTLSSGVAAAGNTAGTAAGGILNTAGDTFGAATKGTGDTLQKTIGSVTGGTGGKQTDGEAAKGEEKAKGEIK